MHYGAVLGSTDRQCCRGVTASTGTRQLLYAARVRDHDARAVRLRW
jgi:hypothetical protein